jgi:hypothetical protein
MPRLLAVRAVLVLACGGCGGKVVRARAEPAKDAVIAVDGREKRQNRWVVSPGEHQVDVTWPDGTRISERFEVRRDIFLVLHHDGRAGAVEGVDQPRRTVAAAPAPGPAPVAPAVPSELGPKERFERAKALFSQGKKSFELAEFDAAIESFEGAYALLSDAESADYDEILVQVKYNLAVVCERSYDVTPEVERLRKARVMFQNYDRDMSRTDPKWAGSKEQQELRTHVQELEKRVEHIESAPR